MNKLIKKNIISFITVLSLEIIFKIFLGISFNTYEIISLVIYSLFTSFIITLITNIFNKKVNRILTFISYFILSLIFALQYVFKAFMKIYFSLDMIKLSDQAVGFLGTTLSVILSKIIYILIFFIPFILVIIFKNKIDYKSDNKKKIIIIYILLILVSYGGYNLSLNLDNRKDLSLKEIYHSINNANLSIPRLGVLPSTILDFYYEIVNPTDTMIEGNKDNVINTISDNKNILDIDLSDNNLDNEVKSYIENNLGTNKNDYTSYFEGKNLVLLVAESYSEVGVSKELTPTLYDLTHSGFIFNNFYIISQ